MPHTSNKFHENPFTNFEDALCRITGFRPSDRLSVTYRFLNKKMNKKHKYVEKNRSLCTFSKQE